MRGLIFALLLSLVPKASLVAGVMQPQAPPEIHANRRVVQATLVTREYLIGGWATRNVEFGRDVEVS